MIPRRIAGANHWLGAPKGWKPEADGNCGHLAIRTCAGDPRHDGRAYCESAWEPTPKELEQLNAGGSIILRIIGWQSPVALYVEKAEFAFEAKEAKSEPADTVIVSPEVLQVCPRCEYELNNPLTRFCLNSPCPLR